MSLDTVKLVIQVEEAFNVEIADTEAEDITRASDFTRVIRNKVQFHPDQKCASQLAYLSIRKGLEDIGVEKGSIHQFHDIPINEIELHHSITTDPELY